MLIKRQPAARRKPPPGNAPDPLTLQVPLGQRDAITIFGTDYRTRMNVHPDYVHIEDLATAHVLALEALGDMRSRISTTWATGAGTACEK